MRLIRVPMDKTFSPYSLAHRRTVGRSTRISSATSSVVRTSGTPASKPSIALGSFIITLHILYKWFEYVKGLLKGFRKIEPVQHLLNIQVWLAQPGIS